MELADDVDSGYVSAKSFQAENYVPTTLRSKLSRGNIIPLEDCVDLGLSLTTALDNLHGHQLVHRDIKPANIVYVNGVPKLADIGLVTSLNATMSIVGTTGFIPPEGPGTPQADLYGLGKTLYEAATGKDRQEFPEAPDLGDTMYLETDYMEFHAILLKACDTEPRDRYPTAQAMSADLALLRKGKSIKRLHLFERRLKIFKKFGIVTALLAVLALSATLYQLHLVDRNRQLASKLRKSSYAVNINLAFQALQDADLPEAKKLLERHRPTDGNDLRDWGWYWLRNQAKGDQYDSFTSSTTNWYSHHLSFSKDGSI
jgi:serine/threonine protein kinase